MFILIFISLICTVLLLLKEYLFFTIFFIIFLIFLRKFEIDKKKIIIILLINLIVILMFFIKRKINFNYFIVLEKKENYLIIYNGFNRYYLNIKYLNVDSDLFDILYFKDYSLNDFNFTKLESGFDFEAFLKSKGVTKTISGNFDVIFDFQINPYSIKNNILNTIEDEKVRIFIKTLLFNTSNDELYELDSFRNLNLINLFSFSGIYLYFAFNLVLNILNYAFNEKISKIISFLLFSPYFLLNIQNFIIIRFILLFLINFYNDFKKEKLNHNEKISIIGSIILISNPYRILSDSFIISFSISFLNYFINNIIKTKRKVLKNIIFNFYLMIFMIPFTIKYNNSLNLLSFIISFIVIPINKILYILGLYLLVFKNNFIIKYILKLYIELINLVPSNFSLINLPPFNNLFLIVYYFLYIIFIYFKEINLKFIYKKILLIDIISLIIYSLPIQNYLYFKISFINVGQGDSALITLNNKNYLIDTGGLTYTDIAKNNLIPYFKKNRIYKIDEVYISHYDNDHYGALESLKANFNIDEIYDYNSFKEKESPFLLKNLNIYKELYDDENNKSLVLYLEYKNIKFLFMGDASKEIESLIIKDNLNLKADYLKIGHHGSNTSSSDDFIKQINPKEAIISCGIKNKYNHPHKETIDTLEKYQIKIRRTDLEGTINYYFFKY